MQQQCMQTIIHTYGRFGGGGGGGGICQKSEKHVRHEQPQLHAQIWYKNSLDISHIS